MTTDLDLDRMLRELADLTDPPPVPVADDVLRGSRRLRTRRLAAGGGACAAVAVVALGIAWLPIGSDSASPTPSTQAPSVSPPTTPDTSATVVRLNPSNGLPVPPSGGDDVIEGIRQAVARHLDPDGEHISRQEIRNANQSGSYDSDGTWVSIQQKVGWTNPGESGLGLVVVGVSRADDYDCGGHGPGGPTETCSHVDLAGTPVLRVDDPDSGTTYAFRRADGYTTSVSLDDLYGNNSTVSVSGIDVTDAQLAALLQDPVLDIPGHPAAIREQRLSGRTIRAVTAAAVDPDGDHLRDESWSGDTGGYYEATWYADGAAAGKLMVQQGLGNFAIDAKCAAWFSARCEHRTVGGIAVRIDYRTHRTGDGYDVSIAGATRSIWVRWDPADPSATPALSVDDAVALALDPGFQ